MPRNSLPSLRALLTRGRVLTELPAGGGPVREAQSIAKLWRLHTLRFPDTAFWGTKWSAWGPDWGSSGQCDCTGSHIEILEWC